MPDMEKLLKPPTEAVRLLILEAAREDEGRLEHNLKLLESWIACQNHLPQNYEKQLLVTFLRGCKHDMQRAKKKLERYFLSRSFDGVLFRNRVITEDCDLKVTTFGYVCPMPELTAEGYRITLRGLKTKDDSLFDVLSLLRHDFMLFEIRFHHDTSTAGDVYIFDAKNFTAPIIGKVFTAEFRKSLTILQTMLPLRIKQIHLIGMNSVVMKLVALVKQILSEKLGKRIFVHSDWESLYKVIPQRLLPSDYGGEKHSIHEITEEWKSKLVEYEGWFRQLDNIKVTGPIPKHVEPELSDYLGAEGSFRKLNID